MGEQKLPEASYRLPKCRLDPRVTHGAFSQDSGKASSRWRQVEARAKQTPGPFIAHTDWKLNKGKSFTKGPKMFNKILSGYIPAPGTHERKSVAMDKMNSVKENLSDIKRVTYGNFPKSRRKLYSDTLTAHMPVSPPITKYAVIKDGVSVQRNKLELHTPSCTFNVPKTESRKKDVVGGGLSPNHYKITYKLTEERGDINTMKFPDGKPTNFIDMGVQSKAWCPGPGKYEEVKLNKVSRGTKWLQTHNVGKGPLAGAW